MTWNDSVRMMPWIVARSTVTKRRSFIVGLEPSLEHEVIGPESDSEQATLRHLQLAGRSRGGLLRLDTDDGHDVVAELEGFRDGDDADDIVLVQIGPAPAYRGLGNAE
jgi:hypothetical protein